MAAVSRRLLLSVGVGAAAAAAGVAWSLRNRGPQVAEPDEAFWALRFPRPHGGELILAELRGRPLLLNFWATWCPPCIRELPALDDFQRKHQAEGWQVVGLAIDGPTPVREFLAKRPLGITVGLAGFEGTSLTRKLGNPQGGLPFTVVFDAAGRIRQRKLGETHAEDLERWAREISA